MQPKLFLDKYFEEYRKLAFTSDVYPLIEQYKVLASRVRDAGGKQIFAGNGASASAAEHGAVDFTKQGGVRSMTFHDPNLITCFANDFGYEHWMAKAIEFHGQSGDIVVLISVSGTSPSVVNAARYARDAGMTVVSFTGRDPNNPLKGLSDLAFHVPSDAYNLVECVHCIWITATIDLLIGGTVYETRAYEL